MTSPQFVCKTAYFMHAGLRSAGKVFHGMIRLNDTGAFLWEQCRKETTKEQVLQAMAEKYEVDESVAADDLDRFLQQLRNAEILEETNE